jgi:hypothetical protein
VTGIERIAAERKRQIEEGGFTAEYDDQWINDELAKTASCYATPECYRSVVIDMWPWFGCMYKRCNGKFPENRIRELEKAGALIAAEIDRLLRKERNTQLST